MTTKKILKNRSVLAIDPGKSGALVWMNSKGAFEFFLMPLNSEGLVSFDDVHEIIDDFATSYRPHVYLERAVSFGMGTKGAFNYGRGFEALAIAVELTELPLTMVEPGKWSKVMHQGIDARLKAKEKSLIAMKRLYPKLISKVPQNRNGKMHDGVIDAILIAGYAIKDLGL